MMKLKTKLTKKQWGMIGGTAVAVILLTVILCIALIPGKSPQTPAETEPTTDSTVSVSDISVEEPEKTDNTAGDTASETEGSDGVTILTPDEKSEDDNEQPSGEKPDEAAKPVTPTPLPEESGNGGSVVIGGETPKPYSCGVAGHHCDGPETHAYILNLELEGCKYCGSHNCPSFYATDEWGNTCYTPSKCPKYDIHNDPVYYCQECGKKCGDGKGGTCVQFVTADTCPNCGQWVEAWKCHTCK